MISVPISLFILLVMLSSISLILFILVGINAIAFFYSLRKPKRSLVELEEYEDPDYNPEHIPGN